MAQANKVQLDANVVVLLRQWIPADLFGLGVEVSQRTLEHGVEPQSPTAIELQRKIADRRTWLEVLRGIFRELEGPGIELGDEQLAEIRIPDVALCIEDDVMRLGGRPRHVVLGDDNAGRPAGGTRQGLE